MATEESEAGFDVESLAARFDDYFAEARRLQQRYADRIEIMVGFETEAYTGWEDEISALIARHEPDMIVGSVHHVHDLLFDGEYGDYEKAVSMSGGIEQLYCDYFDKQLELIERFEPAVVGHLDLIRIYDPDYRERWASQIVRERALRNLDRIRELDLILDLNTRSLSKGADEPYVSEPLMRYAIETGVKFAPGDDSHGVDSVAANMERGVELFVARGGNPDWPKPALGRHRR